MEPEKPKQKNRLTLPFGKKFSYSQLFAINVAMLPLAIQLDGILPHTSKTSWDGKQVQQKCRTNKKNECFSFFFSTLGSPFISGSVEVRIRKFIEIDIIWGKLCEFFWKSHNLIKDFFGRKSLSFCVGSPYCRFQIQVLQPCLLWMMFLSAIHWKHTFSPTV